MANNELAMKFSNEMYATRQDVIKQLGIPLIDNIWNGIIEYRSNFNFILPLKHITGTAYSVCLTPFITRKVNDVERKLNKLVTNFTRLSATMGDGEFKKLSYRAILRSVASKYKISIDDGVLDAIISNQLTVLPPNALILNRYYRCLKDIETNYMGEINDTCLGDFYTYLMGSEELNEFYRTQEVDNSLSRVVIGKLYIGVPCNAIDNSMEELFKFIGYSESSLFIKAVASLYYFYYIKPFENYSEEMSLLLFKKILANNDIGPVASLINFEELLGEKEEFEKWILESQKTFDLTYFLVYVANKANEVLDTALDVVVNAQQSIVKEEFYQPEVTPEATKDEIKTEEVISLKEMNKVTTTIDPNAAHEEVKESVSTNVEPVIQEVEKAKQEEKPAQAQTIIISQPQQSQSSLNFQQNIAITNIPAGLSEEDATRLENHLLEMNPSLSHAQAYFYARHCTLNMNYTISQFKKCLNCAYETARTSMDHLVFLGYYRKEMLRNKFIYTPVKKN